MTEIDRLLRMADAARVLRMTRGGITYAVQRGLLASQKYGPISLILASEVERYRQNRPSPGRKKRAT